MTYKNPRYEGAPEGQFEWGDTWNGWRWRTCLSATDPKNKEKNYNFMWSILGRSGDASFIEFDENVFLKESIKNLLSDAGINAKKAERVDELEEENARLKDQVKELEKQNRVVARACHVISEVNRDNSHFMYDNHKLKAELAAFKAKKAERVDELEEENARLKNRLTLVEANNAHLITNLDTLKAKFTPRPMSEVEVGQVVPAFHRVQPASFEVLRVRKTETGYSDFQNKYNSGILYDADDFIGWLPADTFKGGGDE